MRCAICGGEIDSRTKQCTRCGECWGGGNRGIAREVSGDADYYAAPPPPPTFTEKAISFIQGVFKKADSFLTGCAGKAASLFGRTTTRRQNRIIVCCFILLLLTAVITVSVICSSSCSEPEICGVWISEDSDGSVSVELTADGGINILVLSQGSEKVYRSGQYFISGDLMEIHYDDGEVITLLFSVDRDTAVFTLLSNGQSQRYSRK